MKTRTSTIVAQNLKKLRLAHGFTFRGLAAEIGLAHANVYMYEKLDNTFAMPTLETLERLADLYAVRVADFFVQDASASRRMQLAQGTYDDAVHIINNHWINTGIQFRKAAIPNPLPPVTLTSTAIEHAIEIVNEVLLQTGTKLRKITLLADKLEEEEKPQESKPRGNLKNWKDKGA